MRTRQQPVHSSLLRPYSILIHVCFLLLGSLYRGLPAATRLAAGLPALLSVGTRSEDTRHRHLISVIPCCSAFSLRIDWSGPRCQRGDPVEAIARSGSRLPCAVCIVKQSITRLLLLPLLSCKPTQAWSSQPATMCCSHSSAWAQSTISSRTRSLALAAMLRNTVK